MNERLNNRSMNLQLRPSKTKSNYITSLESRMIYRNSKYIPKQNKPTNWKLIEYNEIKMGTDFNKFNE